MQNPLIAVLVFGAVALALAIKATIWGLNKAADVMIGHKHRALEHISETQSVPPDWRRRNDAKLAHLRSRHQITKARQVEDAAKNAYLSRLAELATYVERTNLVADEETRTLLLAVLRQAREKWTSTDATAL